MQAPDLSNDELGESGLMHIPITPAEQTTMNKALQTFGAKLASRACFSLVAATVTAFQAFASDDLAMSPKPIGTAPSPHLAPAPALPAPLAGEPRRADFNGSTPSDEARQLADWILDSHNNRRLPFLIVDKKHAMAFAFHADGLLRGMTPVLLGMAVGDDSVPGIGQRKLSAIRPSERTTPAGRFVAALDRNLHGAEILWVDYEAAISLHRVITTTPKERRAHRLASPTPLDNRISYGCINVPVEFFDHVIGPAFKGTNGIVYVLPETRSAHEVFGSYDVDQRHLAAGRSPGQLRSQF
jgi:hypothetical protein